MLKKVELYILLLLFITVSACKEAKIKDAQESDLNKNIDQYVELITERHGIPGIALAIIQDGEIIHRANYGEASLEHQVPITDKSIFRVYSLTKPIVTTGLFQLIEKNKLSLEDRISQYLQDLPLAWQDIRIKHLLTHSSGLADIKKYEENPEESAREKVYRDDLAFKAGAKYSYNQSNYWLIQRIIENLTQKSVEDFILQGQFAGQEKERNVFFSTDSKDIELNRVTAYFPFGKGRIQIEHPSRDRYLTSCNGLNISMDQFIEWDRKFKNNFFLKKETKAQMWELFPYHQSTKIFAHGWDQRTINGHISYGFSGSLITAYRIFPEDNLSIIFLSNGLEYFYNIEDIINHLASIVDEDIIDFNNHVFEILYRSAQEMNIGDFEHTFLTLKNSEHFKDVQFEQQINRVGYMLLNLKKYEAAIEVFTLNTQNFPNSWNTYDSLGEAFEHKGDFEKALINYKKALALNTENELNHNDELKRRIRVLENR